MTDNHPIPTHGLRAPARDLKAPTGEFWVERPMRISAIMTGRPTRSTQAR